MPQKPSAVRGPSSAYVASVSARLTDPRTALPLSEVHLAHAQDNTNWVTKPRFAISAALKQPRLLGLHDALILTQHPLIFHSQRAYGCRYIHKIIALSHVDPRYPRPPDPRHPRCARATTTRARRARWRRLILQSRGIFARVARTSPGSRQLVPSLSLSTENLLKAHMTPSPQLFSLGARAGVLHPLTNGDDGTAPTLSDRFQLGGPMNLRMFRANSLGPRDGGAPFFFRLATFSRITGVKLKIIWLHLLLRTIVDSLGGDLFWAAGASLITHLPRKPHWPVKAHAFLNAGQLEPLHRHVDGAGSSLRSSISAALSQPSVSAGVGLIYHFDPVRVELNFGVPLAARASDGTRKGVQVGIGLEFL